MLKKYIEIQQYGQQSMFTQSEYIEEKKLTFV